jgi:hypothetical protein
MTGKKFEKKSECCPFLADKNLEGNFNGQMNSEWRALFKLYIP